MKLISSIRSIVSAIFDRSQTEGNLDEELRAHLENRAVDLERSGLTPAAAERQARIEFGGPEKFKEECREALGARSLEIFLEDVRFAARMVRMSPGFAAVAVLTLALGIGANTAIFSVVDAVLLRPLPYRSPSRLVWASEHFALGPSTVVSADFPAWRDHNHAFEQVEAFSGTRGANLTGAGEPARVSITSVTTGFFSMLGVEALLGRTFLADEGKQGQEHVALLNEGLWRNRFGADPRIIGETIRLDGTGYAVVGVIPETVRYPRADLWTPLALDAEIFSPHSPRWMMLDAIGRLKPDTEISQAQSDLEVIAKEMDKEYPPAAARFRGHVRVEIIPLHELLVHHARSLLMILGGSTALVLLIACANVANLLLSRGVVRVKEMAVRAALGAKRARLLRQLLTEGFLLVTIGGVLGCAGGFSATRILRELVPASLPASIRLDLRIFGFSAAISAAALLAFGLVPAWMASRTDVTETLKEGGVRLGASRGTHRLPSIFSAGQIALSLTLLVGAGLLLRSFLRLGQVDLGFDPHGLLVATVERPLTVAAFDSQQHSAFFQAALERVRNLPGVREAALTERYPLGDPRNAALALHIQGSENFQPPQPISITGISSDYFQVMRIPLVQGRTFSDRDAAAAPGAAIVNQALARVAFGGRDAIGQHISFGGPTAPWKEVVGVAANVREDALDREPLPEIFVPHLQQPSFAMTIVVRTDSDPHLLQEGVRRAVQSVDRNQPLAATAVMEEVIASSVAPRHFRTLLFGLFALLALVLAVIGVYGVMAYSSSQRAREFGVRIALGANRRDILKLVIGQGLQMALAGVGVGIAGALVLTRFLSSLLYGVGPHDPMTFVGVAVLLLTVALAACWIPARKAMHVDPMVALRYE